MPRWTRSPPRSWPHADGSARSRRSSGTFSAGLSARGPSQSWPTWESPKLSPAGAGPWKTWHETSARIRTRSIGFSAHSRATVSSGRRSPVSSPTRRRRKGSWTAAGERSDTSSAVRVYQAIGRLDASGKASFPELYETDFWSWLAEHPDERAVFDTAMEQGKQQRVERFDRVDWRGDETVVDVGGGNGSLLVQLLARQPGLRGIVFDLPETVRDEQALGEKIEFVEGSFFESVPQGDVYVLSTILHDWDDESAAAILRTIREAASPESRLILLEAVVPWQRTGRSQVARPADARALRRPRAQRGPVARAPRGRGLRAGEHRGRLDPGSMPLTVGTAGHIDHGKTWLVRALTGKDTDRLPEEQERGISIDLGYAPLDLPSGRRLSRHRRAGPRALHPQHGRRRERDRPLPARDRRDRGRAASDARAPGDPSVARDRPGRSRRDEGGCRRSGDAGARRGRGARARPRRGRRSSEREDRRRPGRAASGARVSRRQPGAHGAPRRDPPLRRPGLHAPRDRHRRHGHALVGLGRRGRRASSRAGRARRPRAERAGA